jgi:hypothetical protein
MLMPLPTDPRREDVPPDVPGREAPGEVPNRTDVETETEDDQNEGDKTTE